MNLEEIRRNWTPPQELSGSRIRPVRLSGKGKVFVALAVLLPVFGILMSAFLYRQGAQQMLQRQRLATEGVPAQATITRLWRTGGKNETWRVRYQYTVDGRTLEQSHDAPRRIWQTLATGDAIPIRYIPSAPEISHPTAWAVNVMPQWVPFLTGGIFLPLGVLFWWEIRQEWLLLSEGKAAPGIVTSVRRNKQVHARYDFAPFEGSIRRGRSDVCRTNIPSVGQMVTILYDPDNPRRNTMYPTKMVRLDRD